MLRKLPPSIPASTLGGCGLGHSSGWRPGWLPQGLVSEAGPALLPSRCGQGRGLSLVEAMGPSSRRGEVQGSSGYPSLCPVHSFPFRSPSHLVGLARGPLRDFPRQMLRAPQQGWHESLSRDRPRRHGMLRSQPRVTVVSLFILLDWLCGS